MTDPYGDTGQYTGSVHNEKAHGKGTMNYDDGRSYVGMLGLVMMLLVMRDVLQNHFFCCHSNYACNRFFTIEQWFLSKTREWYEGPWHGYGKATFTNGDSYDGE